MQSTKIKELVAGNMAEFRFYRGGQLWYSIVDGEGNRIFTFPIPITDTGSGTFMAEVSAITLMRWVRKALEAGE